MTFHFAAVFYNKNKLHTLPLAKEVCALLQNKGLSAVLISDFSQLDEKNPPDLIISMGGDGTTLNCARYASARNIPIFGINCGTLGFLAACEKTAFEQQLTAILEGDFVICERLLLQVQIEQANKRKEFLALNDCVIRAAQPRAFSLESHFDGRQMPSYFGDGVIVATPTGSTAYSLAAGGPIVTPEVDVLVVTPICPHTLNQRPLILPAQGLLEMKPVFKNKEDRAQISIDGQINVLLPENARVLLSKSESKARLLFPKTTDFFSILNRKLQWGKR